MGFTAAAIRRRLDLPQNVMCKFLGISMANWCQWERGWRVPSSTAMMLLSCLDEAASRIGWEALREQVLAHRRFDHWFAKYTYMAHAVDFRRPFEKEGTCTRCS